VGGRIIYMEKKEIVQDGGQEQGPCILNAAVASLPISIAAFVRAAKSSLNEPDGHYEGEVSCGDN
jgi:hypothetical protein